MRIVIPVLAACLLLSACQRNKLPKGVLPKEKMEAVLWDMIQADEFLREYMLNKDSLLSDTAESIRMYERVFQFNKTSREEFKTSFDYYRTHPVLMKEILDSLNVKAAKPPTEINQPRPLDDKVDTAALRKKRIDTSGIRKKPVLLD